MRRGWAYNSGLSRERRHTREPRDNLTTATHIKDRHNVYIEVDYESRIVVSITTSLYSLGQVQPSQAVDRPVTVVVVADDRGRWATITAEASV